MAPCVEVVIIWHRDNFQSYTTEASSHIKDDIYTTPILLQYLILQKMTTIDSKAATSYLHDNT